MGLKCQKCGTDNAVTEMFCTNCGEKLDLSAVTAEVLAKEEKKKKRSDAPSNAGGVVLGVLLAVVVLLAAAMAIPVGKCTAAEKMPKELQKKLQVLRGKIALKDELVITPQDATDYLTALVKPSEKALNGSMTVKKLAVGFAENGVVQVVFSVKMFGFFPTDCVVRYAYAHGDAGWECTRRGARLGYVPFPGGLAAKVADPVEQALLDERVLTNLQKLLRGVKEVSTEAGEVHVKDFKAPVPVQKPKASPKAKTAALLLLPGGPADLAGIDGMHSAGMRFEQAVSRT